MKQTALFPRVRECKHCGKSFELARKDKVFCSDKCMSNESWRRRHPIKQTVCKECGVTFKGERVGMIFCSHKCGEKNWRINNIQPKPLLFKKCVFCGREFQQSKTHQRWCSWSCGYKSRKEQRNARYRELYAENPEKTREMKKKCRLAKPEQY